MGDLNEQDKVLGRSLSTLRGKDGMPDYNNNPESRQ